VGFEDYGATDDFTTTSVERRLLKSGALQAHHACASDMCLDAAEHTV